MVRTDIKSWCFRLLIKSSTFQHFSLCFTASPVNSKSLCTPMPHGHRRYRWILILLFNFIVPCAFLPCLHLRSLVVFLGFCCCGCCSGVVPEECCFISVCIGLKWLRRSEESALFHLDFTWYNEIDLLVGFILSTVMRLGHKFANWPQWTVNRPINWNPVYHILHYTPYNIQIVDILER